MQQEIYEKILISFINGNKKSALEIFQGLPISERCIYMFIESIKHMASKNEQVDLLCFFYVNKKRES